jgi:predicted nucleic acid-binding protein
MSDVSPPSSLRVFPDTGALLSMLIFPRDRLGNPTLAGEVLDLYQQGAFALIISRAVVDELEEVIDRDFVAYRSQVIRLLAPMANQFTRWPTPEETAATLPFTTDPEDAPSLQPLWSRNRISSSPTISGLFIPLRPNASGPGIRSL